MAGTQSCVSTTFSCSPSGHSQSGKDKQTPVKATGLEETSALDLSKLHSSLKKTTKRRCRACQRKEKMLGSLSCQDDVLRRKGGCTENKKDTEPVGCCVLPEQQRKYETARTGGGSDACSYHFSFDDARFANPAAEDDAHTQTEQMLVKTACNFPLEVADAIKRIESGILELRLITEKLEENSHSGVAIEDMVHNSVCSSVQANKEVKNSRTQEFAQSQAHMVSKSVNDPLRSQSRDHKANEILKKFWKLSQEVEGNKYQKNGQYVQGLRVSPSPVEVAKKPTSSSTKSYQYSLNQETLEQRKIADRPRSVQRPSNRSESTGFAVRSVNRSMAPRVVSSSIHSGSCRSKTRNVSKNMNRGRAASRSEVQPFGLEDSEEIATSSSSYGYMSTSQQQTASSLNSVTLSSGYSSQSNSSRRTSASSSQGGILSTTGTDDDSNSAVSSSTNWQNPRASAPPPQGNARRKARSLRTVNPAACRLRRIKDKLGLIFHHHHHHHHHHHQKESMWSNLHHMLGLGAGNKTRSGKKRPERRTAVVKKQNQVGHFRELVEGLMRHTKRSKKKPEGWKASRKGHGVKLPSKGRLKLGGGLAGNKKKLKLNQFKRLI